MTITPPKKKKKDQKEDVPNYTAKEFLEITDFANKLSLPEIITITESGVRSVRKNFAQEVARYLAIAEGRDSYTFLNKFCCRKKKSKENRSPLRSSLEEMITQNDPKIAQLRDYFQRTVPNNISTIHLLTDLKRDVGLLLGTVAFAKMSETELSALLTTRHKYEWDKTQQSNFQETYYHYRLHSGEINLHEAIADIYNLVKNYETNPLDKLRKIELYGAGKYDHFGQVMNTLLALQPKTKTEVQAGVEYIIDVNERCSTHPNFNLFAQNIPLAPKIYMAREMEKIISKTNTLLFGKRIETLTTVTDFVFNYFHPKSIIPISVQGAKFIKEIVEPIVQFVQENKLQYIINMNLLGASFKEGITEEEFSEIKTFPEQKLALYITNLEILKKIRLPINKKYEVRTRKYEKMLKEEFISLSLEELANRTAIREQINTFFEHDYAGMLLQSSYNNHLVHSAPKESKKILEFIAKNVPYRMMYKLSNLGEHNTFNEFVCSMISLSSYVEVEKITSLCKIIDGVDKNNKNKRGNNPQSIDNYYSLIFLPMQKISPVGSKILLDKEYINSFLQKWIMDSNCSYTESLSLIHSFMDRSEQLLHSMKESTVSEMEKIYNEWFLDLIEQKTVTELKQQLSLGKVVEELNKEMSRSGRKSALCRLSEEQAVFAKMASVYARTAVTVIQTEPIIDHLFLPSLQANRITLPEFIHCFPQFEDNRKIYRFLSFLQAAPHRLGYYDLGKNEDNSPQTIENVLFKRFSNPALATKLWSILTYARVLENIEKEHPILAMEFEEAIQKIKPLQQNYTLNLPLECEQVIYTLENKLLYKTEGDKEANKEIDMFLQKEIMCLCASLGELSNEKVMDLTEKIYWLIEEKYNIPTNKNEMEKQTNRSNIGGNMRLPMQTNAAYAGQEIVYYDEMQGVRQARVIIKRANGIMNDRMSKVRQQHGREIQMIKKKLEEIKPQRVTIKKKMFEGEVDEIAHAEMMLDLKSGISPYTDIFTQRQITERDVAILLSINQSKKLGRWIDQDHRLMDYVRPVALYLMEATTLVGDNLAVYGYNSRGANEVFINIFKDFDEQPSLGIEYKLGLLSAQDNARMGVSYQHCMKRLTEQVAQRRIHIEILTDITEDEGYKGEQMIQDIAQVVREERSKGIELYALCTDPEIDPKKLEIIYGAGHFQIVRNYEDMAKHVVDLYRVMTLS